MAQIDPALMQAAGFAGAEAQQAVGSAQSRAAINTNQLNLKGEQERRAISDKAEASGMLRSTMTSRDLGYQTAEQSNQQQLIDLGLSDVVAGANIDVMKTLAQQQAEAEQMAAQRAIFDQQMAQEWQKLDIQNPQSESIGPDWATINKRTGGRTSNAEANWNATHGN